MLSNQKMFELDTGRILFYLKQLSLSSLFQELLFLIAEHS